MTETVPTTMATTMATTRAHRWVAAAAVAALLALSACSGDDGAAATDTTADGGSATTSGSATTGSTVEPSAGAIVLSSDGIGAAKFGDAVDLTLAAAAGQLGSSGNDSGWGPSFSGWGTCPGTQVRAVIYDRFILLFSDDSSYASGKQHLFSWRLDSVLPETGAAIPATAEGITLGSSVAEVKAAFGADAVKVAEDEQLGSTFTVDGTTYWGRLTSADDDGRVAYLEAGVPCGE